MKEWEKNAEKKQELPEAGLRERRIQKRRNERRLNLMEWAALLLVTTMLGAGIYIWQDAHIEEVLSNKVLRFHVLANSDSEEDQELKLLVRDAVGVYMNELLENVSTQEASVRITEEHLSQIEQVAKNVMEARGCSYPVSAEVEWTDFPDKTYAQFHMPAGRYQALRVVIGEGEGQNWWCVMYPNMCFSDTVFEVVEQEAKENLYQVMTLHEYKKMIESPKKEVRFKYLNF